MKRVVMILNDLMDAKITKILPAVTMMGADAVQEDIDRLNKELEMALNEAVHTHGSPTKV